LLVIFTTWSTPARTALSTTFSSWLGIARLTRITDETPRITASMLAGTSRSPSTTSTPALRQGGGFLRVAREDSGRFALSGQQARRLGSDLAGGGDENHVDVSLAVEM
jgi:hypothetical protein